ncbi:NAD(P)-binding protein, partial [Variovorax sp. CT11-76]
MEFDYVIVGGGSGGATLAARLSEDARVRVCLIEAGGDGRGILV